MTFQVFRRRGERFTREVATRGDRVWSVELGCFVRAVCSGMEVRLRLGVGPNGDELFPTELEAIRAETAALRAETAALRAETAALRERCER